ncbi:MAG: iron-containing alcohol dehydrogenase [Candidatus Cloacimonadaceae bacterium]
MHFLPTRIFFGADAVRKSFVHLNQLGRKALLVTGKHSAQKCGALDDVLNVLNGLKIESVLFDAVTENPILETVMHGAEFFRQNDCDFLVGIGGGSPIDAAKAIALTAANNLTQDRIYDTSAFKKTFPLAAIPTTAGTGTEATQYSVLTDAATQKKAGFGHDLAFPALALVDPKYTLSLSQKVTLNTGIDALSHLLEGIYSNKRTPLLFPLIFQGIRLIYKNLSIVLDHPSDLTARTALSQSSLYGGITIAHTSTTLQHSIGYPLTSVYNVPHGLANGIVMQQIMDLYYPALEAELTELFSFLQISKTDFFTWLDSFGLKLDAQLTDDFIAAKIPEVLASRNMANNPVQVKEPDIRALYKSL